MPRPDYALIEKLEREIFPELYPPPPPPEPPPEGTEYEAIYVAEYWEPVAFAITRRT